MISNRFEAKALFEDPDDVVESLRDHIPAEMIDWYFALDDEVERAAYLHDEIFRHLTDNAPAGFYFGAKGGQYGFFPVDDAAPLSRSQQLSAAWQEVERMVRCGECEACRTLARAKSNVLRAINTAARRYHGDNDIAEFWNQILAENPCSRLPVIPGSASTATEVTHGR